MEDLFGHNRKRIMPKTAEVESYIYHSIPSDRDDYRGIKDTSFGLEDIDSPIIKQGSLSGNSNVLTLLGSGIPKIDPYIYNSISSAHGRYREIDLEELSLLSKMTGDEFKGISTKLPANVPNLTMTEFKNLRNMLTAVVNIADKQIINTLEAVSQICSTEYGIEESLKYFLDTASELSSLVADVTAENRDVDNNLRYVGEDNNQLVQIEMVQEDIEAAIIVYRDCIDHINNLRFDITRILSYIQNIVAHCIRIEEVYNQFTPMGRPSKGRLATFASDIEKIPHILEMCMYSVLSTTRYLDAIILLNKNR